MEAEAGPFGIRKRGHRAALVLTEQALASSDQRKPAVTRWVIGSINTAVSISNELMTLWQDHLTHPTFLFGSSLGALLHLKVQRHRVFRFHGCVFHIDSESVRSLA